MNCVNHLDYATLISYLWKNCPMTWTGLVYATIGWALRTIADMHHLTASDSGLPLHDFVNSVHQAPGNVSDALVLFTLNIILWVNETTKTNWMTAYCTYWLLQKPPCNRSAIGYSETPLMDTWCVITTCDNIFDLAEWQPKAQNTEIDPTRVCSSYVSNFRQTVFC